MGHINIIMHGAEKCSGFCSYCNARIDDLVSQGFNLNDVTGSLKDIDSKNYETVQYDFDALEKRLMTHPASRSKSGVVTIWGADPFSSAFTAMNELVDFIEYLNKEKGCNFTVGMCTNGLGFLIPDWVDYALKHKLHISLSHDLLGQEVRTIKKEFDPIFTDGFNALASNKNIQLISPVLHQYNADPVANYDYFMRHIGSVYPHMQLRLSKTKNGEYDIHACNRSGLLNGQYYEELKGKPYGDMLIHNDLTSDNPILRRQLDLYCDGWKYIYDHLSSFQKCASHAIKFARLNNGVKPKNNCYNFQNGITDYSGTIDTLGLDCECMLMDSRHKSIYKDMAPYCNDCKYKGRYECKECNVMEPAKQDPTALHNCKFNYRYQELMDYANARLDYYEVKKELKKYGNGLRKNNNVSTDGNRRCEQTKNRLCKTQSNKGTKPER